MHPILSIVTTLARPHQCAPGVAPNTTGGITKVEIGRYALDVHDNTSGTRYAPATRGAMLSTNLIVAHHHDVDVGVMRVSSANLTAVGPSVADVFDACGSMCAGSIRWRAMQRTAWGVPFDALALNVIVTFSAGLALSAPMIWPSPIPFWAAAVPIHMLLRNPSGGGAGKAVSGAAVATCPSRQSLSWWLVSLASPWRESSCFLRLLWPVVSLGVPEHIDSPLRRLADRPRAKLGQSLIRREISKQFGIDVDRTDCNLKLCGLAHKIRSILSIRQQRRDRLERRRWQTHHNSLRIQLSASHAPICSGGNRFHQRVHRYAIR